MTLDFSDIPENTRKAIDAFVKDGTQPGGFVDAVLRNNLRQACAYADPENLKALLRICVYCFQEIPDICWGSQDRVSAWISFKRQQREMEQLAKKGSEE